MKKTLKIGSNRGKARIWIEGQALASMGWNKGDTFFPVFGEDTITYVRSDVPAKCWAEDEKTKEELSKVKLRKVAGTPDRPIIDTNTDRIRESVGDASHVEIKITRESITIRPTKAPSSGIAGAVAAVALVATSIAMPYLSQFAPNAKRVLVACEESATVRDEFTKRGHDAVSCDLLPTRNPSGWHVQGRVEDLLGEEWDLVLGFPPCTYLTNSAAWAFKDPDFDRYPGVGYHQRVKPGTLTGAARRQARVEAVELVKAMWKANTPAVAIENPVGSLGRMFRKCSQTIQPHEFGDPESKTTCLWLRGLPELVASEPLDIEQAGWQAPDGTWRWMNQTASGQSNVAPSADRQRDRSKTYAGIARAMAAQWG